MFYINIDKKKTPLGELKFIPFYFLEGVHSDFQKGVMYASHQHNLYPLYHENGKLVKLPEYAEMGSRDFKEEGKLDELMSKIDSGKSFIDAAEYLKKWDEEVGDDLDTEEVSRIPNRATESRIMSFEDFVFEKEYNDATDRVGQASFKDILEVLLDKKLKKSDFGGEDKTIDDLVELGASLNDTEVSKLGDTDKKFLVGQIGAAHGAGSGLDPEREYHIDPADKSLSITLDDEHELEITMDGEKLSDMYKELNKRLHKKDKKKAPAKAPAAPAAAEETPPAA